MSRFDPTVRSRTQHRHFTASKVKIRAIPGAEGAAPTNEIVGHAAVFDQLAVIYECEYWRWEEVIRPGAFARAIREGQDVRSLFNHDANYVLGRTTAKTLALSEDEIGLFTVTQAPNTQTILDLVIAPIGREDVTGMSFAFTPVHASKVTCTEDTTTGTEVYDLGGERITCRYAGEKLIETHEVLDCDLFDISPVTYPAYTGTDVALRSIPDIAERIREMNRPHRRKTPRLDAARARLESRGLSPLVRR